MIPRVGDFAYRIHGTSAGFRVRSQNEIVAVKTHIRLRNNEGIYSKFLDVDDFDIIPSRQREVVWSFLIIWRSQEGELRRSICQSQREAVTLVQSIINIRGTVLAKKKIRVEI